MKEITLLGNQNTKYEYDYNPKILERFELVNQILQLSTYHTYLINTWLKVNH